MIHAEEKRTFALFILTLIRKQVQIGWIQQRSLWFPETALDCDKFVTGRTAGEPGKALVIGRHDQPLSGELNHNTSEILFQL